MNFFLRKGSKKINNLESLIESRRKLIEVTQLNLESSIENINVTTRFYENLKKNEVSKYDNLMNLSLHAAITDTDLIILCEGIRVSSSQFKKLFYARILSLVIIEYLNDINQLLGNKLIKELNDNLHFELIGNMKIINSELATIRKKHQKSLTFLRNNIAAHKTKDSLNLVKAIFNLDPEEIFEIGSEIMRINTKITSELTNVLYRIIDDLNTRAE